MEVSSGFTGSWCESVGSLEVSSVFLLVSGVVLVVLEGFQWVLLVSWLVLLVLGACQLFSLVTGVFLLILGGFQSF